VVPSLCDSRAIVAPIIVGDEADIARRPPRAAIVWASFAQMCTIHDTIGNRGTAIVTPSSIVRRTKSARTEETTMNERPVQHTVQLGCGTLIIIALIVIFFSRSRDTGELRSQIDRMNQKIDRLEGKIDALSQKLAPPPASAPNQVERP
jgi:hypothetical protein